MGIKFFPCHGSVFGGFTDPMAVERREIVGNFKSLTSILAHSDLQLDRVIQVSILIFVLLLKTIILKHIILNNFI